jgi:hypothetical protein
VRTKLCGDGDKYGGVSIFKLLKELLKARTGQK